LQYDINDENVEKILYFKSEILDIYQTGLHIADMYIAISAIFIMPNLI